MEWNLLFFFNSILLGVGLAMDAFSVSLSNGLNEPHMRVKKNVYYCRYLRIFPGIYAYGRLVLCSHDRRVLQGI